MRENVAHLDASSLIVRSRRIDTYFLHSKDVQAFTPLLPIVNRLKSNLMGLYIEYERAKRTNVEADVEKAKIKNRAHNLPATLKSENILNEARQSPWHLWRFVSWRFFFTKSMESTNYNPKKGKKAGTIQGFRFQLELEYISFRAFGNFTLRRDNLWFGDKFSRIYNSIFTSECSILRGKILWKILVQIRVHGIPVLIKLQCHPYPCSQFNRWVFWLW